MSILIAGAGPAGSRLAEILANRGCKVTLVDRLKNAYQNSFSSAVVPISSIDNFSIPIKSISAYWKSWQIFAPDGSSHKWSSKNELGVVLDFGELRQQLWTKAINAGVEMLSGWKVNSVHSLSSHAQVELQDPNGNKHLRKVLFVVDATGQKRSLIKHSQASSNFGNDELLKGTGIEWILQDEKSSNKWKNSISFFLGSCWINHGYGWIFPMAKNKLKVGFCSIIPPNSTLCSNSSNINALKKLLSKFSLNTLPVIERHGGEIKSTIKRRESHSDGRLVGIGDAVSTANLLGGEGIRHALLSAEILAPLLEEACNSLNISKNGEFFVLQKYQKSLSRCLGWRWTVSNRIAKKTWWGLSGKIGDERLFKLLNGLALKASAEDISALLFEYEFERYGLRLLPYLIGLR